MLNVRRDHLERVLQILPALATPTLSALTGVRRSEHHGLRAILAGLRIDLRMRRGGQGPG